MRLTLRVRAVFAVAGALALSGLAGACAPSVESPSPATSGTPVASPSPAVSATGPSAGCPVTTQTGALSSDRLASVDVSAGAGFDRVVFRFGDPSSAPTEPRGTLREATPPFFHDGSGEPAAVDGRRFVELRFDGMLLGEDDGTPVYEGESELRPRLAAVEHLVMTGAFEGVVTWVVGLSGAGCVTLGSDPAEQTVTLDVAHG